MTVIAFHEKPGRGQVGSSLLLRQWVFSGRVPAGCPGLLSNDRGSAGVDTPSGSTRLLLDLGDVSMIDSSGIGLAIRMLATAEQQCSYQVAKSERIRNAHPSDDCPSYPVRGLWRSRTHGCVVLMGLSVSQSEFSTQPSLTYERYRNPNSNLRGSECDHRSHCGPATYVSRFPCTFSKESLSGRY
jgi:hypothetical protein